MIQEGIQAPINDLPADLAFTACEPVVLNARDLDGFHSEFVKPLIAEGVRSACCLPPITRGAFSLALIAAILAHGELAHYHLGHSARWTCAMPPAARSSTCRSSRSRARALADQGVPAEYV